MLTLGVDMAAQPANTAVVLVEWPGGGDKGTVVDIASDVGDDDLLTLMAEADRTGIDAPLGWPDLFVRHVAGWRRGSRWPSRYSQATDSLRYRLTDRWMAESGFGFPLSVSTDRIATLTLRTAWLLSELEFHHGVEVDRSGVGGRVAECWPRAGRRVWDASSRAGFDRLRKATVRLARGMGRQLEDPHAADAFVAALMGRAVALGMTDGPPDHDLEIARAEGWIHVPLHVRPTALLG